MAKTDVTSQESDNGKEWASDLVKRIGVYAKTLRGTKSAQWLSDETAALGMRISPSVIARLDSGHRGDVLSVPELLVIARALGVSPMTLLLAGASWDGDVAVLPDQHVSTLTVVDWLRGVGTLAAALAFGGVDTPPAAAAANDAAHALAGLADVRHRLDSALAQWSYITGEDEEGNAAVDPSVETEKRLLLALIEELQRTQDTLRRSLGIDGQ